ncbi:MAG: hypothetical protein MHMPM18_000452 [Marteilia pararefringens]
MDEEVKRVAHEESQFEAVLRNFFANFTILIALLIYAACAGNGLCDGVADRCISAANSDSDESQMHVVYAIQFSFAICFASCFYFQKVTVEFAKLISNHVSQFQKIEAKYAELIKNSGDSRKSESQSSSLNSEI